MHRTGAYDFTRPVDDSKPPSDHQMPSNRTIASLVSGLCSAHAAYGPSKTGDTATPGILFVVQPRNMNICDERPLEYALWSNSPSIPAYRVIFGEEVLAHTHLSPTKELLFHPPSLSSPIEIAVVYMRAGYDVEEYTRSGYAARLLLEQSCAIKCPSILCHLATFKKVQQELAAPGVLGRFLSPEDANTIAKTFAPMYPMDGLSEAGKKGRALACDTKTASNYVLKPSLEGGGHNIYGADIPTFLESVPESQWQTFILMELINPLVQKSILLTTTGIYHGAIAEEDRKLHDRQCDSSTAATDIISHVGGPTVSELGIFGVCMWQCKDDGAVEIIANSKAGWSLKTKPANVKEMSVVKGYGCFDSPYLVD